MSSANPYPILRLRPKEDRRLRAGHLWVYSNEIDVQKTPLTAVTPGSVCRMEDAQGKALGLAHVNPHTLLCARLLSRDPHVRIDEGFYRSRLQQALRMRERLFGAPFYRLVHGEGDGLPGLVIDRYEDHLVLQAGSLGMDRDLPLITAALQGLLRPAGILLKASGAARRLEGLEDRVEVLFGHIPERLEVWENDCLFQVDPRGGQKPAGFMTIAPIDAACGTLPRGAGCWTVSPILAALPSPWPRPGQAPSPLWTVRHRPWRSSKKTPDATRLRACTAFTAMPWRRCIIYATAVSSSISSSWTPRP